MNQSEIEDLLRKSRIIAVVGLSDNPARDSHRVAAYLQSKGYRIIPVNPMVREVLGEKAFASLREIGEPVDILDVFRRSEAVPEIAAEAIEIGAKALWLQDGVIHEAAAETARRAGLKVVMDDCLLRVHRRLIG